MPLVLTLASDASDASGGLYVQWLPCSRATKMVDPSRRESFYYRHDLQATTETLGDEAVCSIKVRWSRKQQQPFMIFDKR
jgi:hypothetical protein